MINGGLILNHLRLAICRFTHLPSNTTHSKAPNYTQNALLKVRNPIRLVEHVLPCDATAPHWLGTSSLLRLP